MSKHLSQKEHVLLIAKHTLAALVHNMSSAEGNPISMAGVVALLDGVAVAGHTITDQNQVLRLERGWKEVFRLVESNRFELSKKTAIQLNELVATDEARKVGAFRDDQVGIQGVECIPPHHSRLDHEFDKMLDEVNLRQSVLDRAVTCFAYCARTQFFFDGNKGTSQLLMNGILLSNSQHAITVPAKGREEYFSALRGFYDSNASGTLTQFLKDRQLDKLLQARQRAQDEQKREDRLEL